MVYLFGMLGFIGGFSIGLFVIHLFLKDLDRQKLIEDKSLRWTYGLAVWVLAGLGAYAGVWAHDYYWIG